MVPYLTVENPSVVRTKLRSSARLGGVLQTFGNVEIPVIYECQARGRSSVSLTMGIPPFSNLTVSWTKGTFPHDDASISKFPRIGRFSFADHPRILSIFAVECGGHIASSLMIGTKPKADDVVQHGIVQKQYKMSEGHIGTSHSEDHFHLGSKKVLWRLFIWTKSPDDDGLTASQGLYMSQPVLLVGDTSVVFASRAQMYIASTTGQRRAYSFRDSTMILKDSEVVELSFYLVCKKVGESRILVTLPLNNFDALEFGFAKKCDKNQIPRMVVGTAVTTSSLGTVFIILGALACVGAIAFGFYRIRQRQVEYKRVPTGQR